jgi:hypothetical protein
MYDDDGENNVTFEQKQQYHYQKQKYQLYGYTDVVGLKAFEAVKRRAYKDATLQELFMNSIQKEAQRLEKYNFPYEVVDSIGEKNLTIDYILILNPLAFLLAWYMSNYIYDKKLFEEVLLNESSKIDMFTIQRYKLYIQHKILKKPLQYGTSTEKTDKYLKEFNAKFEPKQKYQKIKETLHDLLPEIFPRGYARFCLKAPTKTDDEKDFEFPKKSGHHFSCKNHEGFSHIGLKNNNLANSEKYPLLPCCYQKSQDKPTSNIEIYKNEENFEELLKKDKTTVDSTKLVGSKSIYSISNNKRFAYLPYNIKLILSILDIDKTYVRMSVNKDPKSSLYCLLECFKKNEKDVINKLKNMVENEFGNCNKRELLDILQTGKFMDAKKFIPFYEEIFNCNILMFCLDINKNPNGTLCTQYYNYKIFKQLDNKPFVILFESLGSEMDNYSYPQYELIVSTQVDNERVNVSSIKSLFSRNEIVIQKLIKIYKEQFPISIEKLQFKSNIINQLRDNNNLVRILQFDNVNCLIDPVNAFNINIKSENEKLFLNDIGKVEDFLIVEQLIDNYLYKIDGKVLGVVSTKKINGRSINIYFPVKETQNLPNYPEYNLSENNAICPKNLENNSESMLNIYRNYKKINRCMISLLSYLYSTFRNKFLDITFDELYKDCQELLIISNEKSKLERNLSLDNPFYVNNKLKIPNEKYGIKLVYSLYLYLKNNHKEVEDFKNKKFIPNYYEDINDFDIDNSYTLLNNVSLELFNNYKSNDYTVYDMLQTNREVFYMKNDLIEDGSILFVKRVDFDNDYERTFYIYEGDDKIQILKVENKTNPMIVANVDDNIIFYEIKKLI